MVLWVFVFLFQSFVTRARSLGKPVSCLLPYVACGQAYYCELHCNLTNLHETW